MANNKIVFIVVDAVFVVAKWGMVMHFCRLVRIANGSSKPVNLIHHSETGNSGYFAFFMSSIAGDHNNQFQSVWHHRLKFFFSHFFHLHISFSFSFTPLSYLLFLLRFILFIWVYFSFSLSLLLFWYRSSLFRPFETHLPFLMPLFSYLNHFRVCISRKMSKFIGKNPVSDCKYLKRTIIDFQSGNHAKIKSKNITNFSAKRSETPMLSPIGLEPVTASLHHEFNSGNN